MSNIIISTKNKEFRRLVLNEEIILLNKDDSISFKIEDKNLRTQLIVLFVNEGEKFTADFAINSETNIITLKLFQWDDTELENSAPVIFETKAGLKAFIKYKTKSSTINNFRSFHICLWIAESK